MTFRRFSAVTTSIFLILALLAGQPCIVVPQESFIVPCQDYLRDTPTISAEETPAECGLVILKQKKFVDLFLTQAVTLFSVSSHETRLIAYSPFSAVPEVYPDIFIPPDGRS